MKHDRTPACILCGEEKAGGDNWFLLTENRWLDRLKVLYWDEALAGQQGVHCACSAAHLEQLVVHWMTTGSLEYPFARVPLEGENPLRELAAFRVPSCFEVNTRSARQIGELAVDRDSLQRALIENPQSLSAILDALLSAVDGHPINDTVETEEAESAFWMASREI